MELKVFNRAKALEMVDGDTELMDILLSTFSETDFSLDNLNKLISDKNYAEAASYTHRVKGAGRQLAMEKLAFSGQQLEDVLRSKATGDLKTLVETFYSDYIEALEASKNPLN